MVKEEDTIYVVSLTLTQEEIDNSNLRHVKLIKVGGMEKFKFFHYNSVYYQIWQWKAYRTVLQLGIQIDFIHVYSLSDFRQPGYWYHLKNAYSVFGPVGGGQVCPKSLCEYDDKYGKVHNVINSICKWNPWYKNNIKHYSRTYACNTETKGLLPNSKLLVDVPLNDDFKNIVLDKQENKNTTLLSVGRLINKKGILFLLDILVCINPDLNWQLFIYGDGEQKYIIEDRILQLGLQTKVFLKGKVSYNKISDVYKRADIFVLPSLRESGGSVLIEAMAHKLPVVALNMALAKILNEYKCGLFVDTAQEKSEILEQFANHISTLIKNSKLRYELGNNGYNYVNNELTWDNMIKEVYGNFMENNGGIY